MASLSRVSSLVIMIIEYPISKRRPKGPRRRDEERPYQLEAKIVHLVYYSKLFRNYIARFALYIVYVFPGIISSCGQFSQLTFISSG